MVLEAASVITPAPEASQNPRKGLRFWVNPMEEKAGRKLGNRFTLIMLIVHTNLSVFLRIPRGEHGHHLYTRRRRRRLLIPLRLQHHQVSIRSLDVQYVGSAGSVATKIASAAACGLHHCSDLQHERHFLADSHWLARRRRHDGLRWRQWLQ